MIVLVRFSEDSAASRNATASTMPRSKRLTRPSSGSPPRSSCRRSRDVTRGHRLESIAGSISAAAHILEVGEVLAVDPVADEREPEGDRADQQPEHGHAERHAQVLAQARHVALGQAGRARGRAGSACPSGPSAGPARTSRRVRSSRLTRAEVEVRQRLGDPRSHRRAGPRARRSRPAPRPSPRSRPPGAARRWRRPGCR